MSIPSIKSPKSPPPQWLSNDNKHELRDKRSHHEIASEQSEVATSHEADADNAGSVEEAHTLPMSYPIHENLFYSAPSQQLAENTTVDVTDEHIIDQETSTEELLHPPDFKSLFALIEDPETGDHYHPTVHYIFSDDDPEILTSAALEVLDDDREAARTNAESDDYEERHVIVDLAADGKSVTSASSMSPDWQALKTTIRKAPSLGDEIKNTDKGLMLMISGQDSKVAGALNDKKKRQPQPGNLDDLVQAFVKRLDRVDEVLGKTQAVEMDNEMVD